MTDAGGRQPEPARGGAFAPLRNAYTYVAANAPWLLTPRFILSALLIAALIGGSSLVLGYVAAKRAIPYFVRIGVIEPAAHTIRTWLGVPDRVQWSVSSTQFGPIETASIQLTFAGRPHPASVADVEGNLVVMLVDGTFAYLTPSYEVRSLDLPLPMNRDALLASEYGRGPNFNPHFFRAHDLLAVGTAPNAFDLYASYDRFTGSCFEIVVARARLTVTDARIEAGSGWEDVYVAEPCAPPKTTSFVFAGHQVGGRLDLLDPGTLLLSLGDVEFDGDQGRPDAPQSEDWDFGKLIAISLSTGRSTHWARGFRNPQGLLVDSQGRVWETEHGPQGGDEVNLVRQGANYGWPLVTYGGAYHAPSPHTRWRAHDGFARPAYVFTPAVAPSQLIEPSAEQFPFWDGCLLLSSLRGQSLYALCLDGDAIVTAEPIFLGVRLRDLLSRPNGEIAMVTDEGALLLMRRRVEGRDEPGFQVSDRRTQPARTAAPEAAPAEAGRQVFAQACGACHSVTGQGNVGPHLNGVVGRDIASVDGYAYSEALRGASGAWTNARLRSYLVNPEVNFSGTTMPAPGISDAQTRDVIAYLRATE